MHKCFALAPDPSAITRIFGSPQIGKVEIMTHWEAAAAQPDGQVIAVELMRSRDFPYPYSMPGLKACKAAEFLGGQAVHWDMFDRIQCAHAVEARNIADPDVLRSCARDIGLDEAAWAEMWAKPEVTQAVWQDIKEADLLGIRAVPTVVFDHRWRLTGAVPEDSYRAVLERLLSGRVPGSSCGHTSSKSQEIV